MTRELLRSQLYLLVTCLISMFFLAFGTDKMFSVNAIYLVIGILSTSFMHCVINLFTQD